jgi:hypothetical protein
MTNYSTTCDPQHGGTGGCTATTPAITALTYYAAGLCKATINGYSDWYVPAICEMDAVNGSFTCVGGTQSMVNSLSFLIGDPSAGTPATSCSPPAGTNCLAGFYWSSTELSFVPQVDAWYEQFSSSGGGNFPGGTSKALQFGVRCSRALTL